MVCWRGQLDLLRLNCDELLRLRLLWLLRLGHHCGLLVFDLLPVLLDLLTDDFSYKKETVYLNSS